MTAIDEMKYTEQQICDAIEFGTELGNTTGFFEGDDSWIENQIEDFIKRLNETNEAATTDSTETKNV
jgi:hypothetical protein